VGLIKFGSRTDILLDTAASLQVKKGDRVKGGASVLAYWAPAEQRELAAAVAEREGGH
jgi:phosphatidylserine decarboxylase